MSNVWEDLHKQYEGKDWLEKPSIFAEQAIKYFPEQGVILDLGAGQGQDSIYFAESGYQVICSDRELSIVELAENNAKKHFDGPHGPMRFEVIDVTKPIPLAHDFVDVVYAHLSLHYFDEATTRAAFKEIHRVLKPGGILAFFVNSTSDPEYGSGEMIEKDLYFVEGKTKRYMSVESAKDFAKDFEVIVADDSGETYKDADKGVHNLVRFIGRKAA